MSTPLDSGRRPDHVQISQTVAASLLDIGAVIISPDQPFTWASGIQSPIYCDNRLSLGYPPVRKAICDSFRVHLEDWIGASDVVIGTATAGIPHAAWLADACQLPMAYVRSSAKGHGRQNQIEGVVREGWKAVVIEDLVSTGGSSLKAVQAVRDAGVTVLGVGCIFSYGLEEARSAFEKDDVHCRSLTTLEALLAVAAEKGLLSESQIDSVRKWRTSPQTWRPQ